MQYDIVLKKKINNENAVWFKDLDLNPKTHALCQIVEESSNQMSNDCEYRNQNFAGKVIKHSMINIMWPIHNQT